MYVLVAVLSRTFVNSPLVCPTLDRPREENAATGRRLRGHDRRFGGAEMEPSTLLFARYQRPLHPACPMHAPTAPVAMANSRDRYCYGSCDSGPGMRYDFFARGGGSGARPDRTSMAAGQFRKSHALAPTAARTRPPARARSLRSASRYRPRMGVQPCRYRSRQSRLGARYGTKQ